MDEFDFHDCSECNHALELPSQQREQLIAGLARVRLLSAGEEVAKLARQHAEAFKVPMTVALTHVLRNAPTLAEQYLAERHGNVLRPGSA